MAVATKSWIRDSFSVYVGNATAVRDYRVQLRGNRAVILWAVYLIVLIGFGMLTYDAAASREQMSVVDAQASLKNFYNQIIYLLSVMIFLIAPALSATAIVSERQRKSLDLVFSAPVSPKYYLVGKLISSYRYIWMLLVLSLPVTAACVVLGGASWSEVLVSYLLMSVHGLIYTSIALLFSTLAQKPMGAIVWSYIAIACFYIPLTSFAGEIVVASSGTFGARGTALNEIPFVACLSPFTVQQGAPSYTILFDHHIPNWFLTILFALMFTKLMLLGAASVLSPFGSPETKSLRIHGLIYAFLLTIGVAASVASVVPMARSIGSMSGVPPTPPVEYQLWFGRMYVALLTNLVFILPFVTCFGTDLEKKFWPDGIFRIRKILVATPAGGLPYLLALCLAIVSGIAVFAFWRPEILGLKFAAYVFYGIALVFACWSVGRLTSAINNGLRYARTLQFTALVLGLWLPIPFLAIADPFGLASPSTGAMSGSINPAGIRPAVSLWDFYVLRPLFSSEDKTLMALGFGTILLILGLLITVGSDKLARAKYARAGLTYE